MPETLIEAIDLKKYYPLKAGMFASKKKGQIQAVDGVSFKVYEGDTFGIVGESGCGKTTILKMILLLENITDGCILFRNKDISTLSKKGLLEYRKQVQAMFQDPYSSLNPRMRIKDILSEPMEIHLKLSKEDIKRKVNHILTQVDLPEECAEYYPHEFSGGQRQRIALARAIAIDPRLMILDEPVSALDVSIRAQLMNTLMEIQQKSGISYIFIAHDLAVVRYMSNRMMVMYLGKIVEYGKSESIYTKRLHPYTKALFSAALPSHPEANTEEEIILKGEVPSPINPPSGCHFHPRCMYATEICHKEEPLLIEAENDHKIACHLWDKINY